MPTTLSPSSPAALRERIAELIERHQHLIVHGDVVSRADCKAEIEALQTQLRGTPAPKKAPDDAFFGRSCVAEAKAGGLIRDPGQARPVTKDGRDVTAGDGTRAQWIDVTPKKAAAWLENNFRNRPLSDDVVAAYARDMKNGTWVPTHQGIAFNDRDELIDGQHRLRAIVRSGCTVRMMVTFGLASQIKGSEMTTMDAVDRGRTRSVADQLKIQHGMKEGSAIAAVCSTIGGICFGERTRRLSVSQTLEIFRAFEDPIKWVIANRPREHGLRSAGVLAAFAFAIMADERCTSVFGRITSGAAAPESAAGRLRTFLLSDDAKLLNRGTDRGLAELVLEALRLDLAGQAVSQLDLSTEGADHFRALQTDRVAKVAALFALP